MSHADVTVRVATPADARRLAELHSARISEGFLAQLGVRFVERLYRRIVASPDAFVYVATSADGVVGFVAGASDVARLYRRFLVRDGIVAGVVAAPRLLRSWRRVFETLRYPARAEDLPAAEILALAVDAPVARRGVGRQLVAAALEEFGRRGVVSAKVVAGADNRAALALYTACGFASIARFAVHEGTPSEVLVWSSR